MITTYKVSQSSVTINMNSLGCEMYLLALETFFHSALMFFHFKSHQVFLSHPLQKFPLKLV